MNNLEAVCEAAWTSLKNTVKCTCYLSDMKNYWEFNKVYSEYFEESTAPARECIGISELPLWADIEISLIAVV